MKVFNHSVRVVGDDRAMAWCERAHIPSTVAVSVDFSADPHIEYQIASETLSSRRIGVIVDYFNLLIPHTAFGTSTEFMFQGADTPVDAPSYSWQKYRNSDVISVLPDFYYVLSDGYRSFLPDEVTPWHSRQGKAVWRGSNTGALAQDVALLCNLPRYKLCEIGRLHLKDVTDFAFTSVLQEKTANDKAEMEEHLRSRNLLTTFMSMDQYTEFKMMIQIDGNGNSWEIVKKMRTGCCMLLVGSKWELWHDKPLRPWQHFVPISNDLSDLADKIEWCLSHDEEAEKIASRGRRAALSLDFEDELSSAASSLWDGHWA